MGVDAAARPSGWLKVVVGERNNLDLLFHSIARSKSKRHLAEEGQRTLVRRFSIRKFLSTCPHL